MALGKKNHEESTCHSAGCQAGPAAMTTLSSERRWFLGPGYLGGQGRGRQDP